MGLTFHANLIIKRETEWSVMTYLLQRVKKNIINLFSLEIDNSMYVKYAKLQKQDNSTQSS